MIIKKVGGIVCDSEVFFVIHTVSSDFCPISNFSTVDFSLKAYTDAPGMHRIGMDVNKLFKVKVEAEDIDVLKFIRNNRNCPWPPIELTHKQSEKVTMPSVSAEILMPLYRKVIIKKAYQCVLMEHAPTDIKCQAIGMGSVHTCRYKNYILGCCPELQ